MSGPQREVARAEFRIWSAPGAALREDRIGAGENARRNGTSAPRQAGIMWFAGLAGNTSVCLRLGVARVKHLENIDGDRRAMRSSREAASSAGLTLSAHPRDLALRSALFFGSDPSAFDYFP
ncbi:MAG: hypothetical protein QOI66_3066 [Myxococcales bacterium]|jgi:hypothetical protein|nr:hypothetical protein [Myxococcales bacterium]